MKISVSVPSAALVAVATHAESTTLAPLSVEGALLSFDFSGCETVEAALESVDAMDAFLGLIVAESDDATEISQVSALKAAVVAIRSDVTREYAYKTRARESEEAIETDAGSQLHANSHTDISNSPSSNGASLETNEEVSEDYGTQEQSAAAEQPARSGRAGGRRKR